MIVRLFGIVKWDVQGSARRHTYVLVVSQGGQGREVPIRPSRPAAL